MKYNPNGLLTAEEVEDKMYSDFEEIKEEVAESLALGWEEDDYHKSYPVVTGYATIDVTNRVSIPNRFLIEKWYDKNEYDYDKVDCVVELYSIKWEKWRKIAIYDAQVTRRI